MNDEPAKNDPIPMVDLTAQHRTLKAAILGAVGDLLERGSFVLGEAVERFEEEAAAYVGVRHAVGVASGTDALDLALRAAGVRPGDEVITPAFSFFAVAEVIERLGATPVFVDIDEETMNLDAGAAGEALTERTRAVVPVHLYGTPAPIDALRRVLRGRDVAIVEDAAQAFGASLGGRKAGALGDIAAFSFYPTKNLGACGEGGLVATNRDDWARAVRSLRDHGQNGKYRHERFGWNSRLHAMQAAILSLKLPHLDGWNAERRATAARYGRLLAPFAVRLPVEPEGAESVYHQFAIRAAGRNRLRRFLAERRIATAIHYPGGLHEQPVFGGCLGPFPVTERAGREVLCLPIYPGMPGGAVERVARAVGDGLEMLGGVARREK